MLMWYALFTFLTILICAGARQNLGWRHTIIRTAGVFAFLLAGAALITPFFVEVNVRVHSIAGAGVDPGAISTAANGLWGLIGFGSGVVLIGVGFVLLAHAREIGAGYKMASAE